MPCLARWGVDPYAKRVEIGQLHKRRSKGERLGVRTRWENWLEKVLNWTAYRSWGEVQGGTIGCDAGQREKCQWDAEGDGLPELPGFAGLAGS